MKNDDTPTGKKFNVVLPPGKHSNEHERKLHDKLHATIAKTQAELGRMEVSGAAGGGMVRVNMNCERKVRSVEISAEAAADREMLQDLVASAVADALAKVDEAVSEKMRVSVESALNNTENEGG